MFHIRKEIVIVASIWIFATGINCNSNSPRKLKISTSNSCLSQLAKFADTLQINSDIDLKQKFSSNNVLMLNSCDYKIYRSNIKFKKAIAVIILKLGHYLSNNDVSHKENLLPIYTLSPLMKKIIDEYYYWGTGSEMQGPEKQEVQIISATSVVPLILHDKELSKDKELRQMVKSH